MMNKNFPTKYKFFKKFVSMIGSIGLVMLLFIGIFGQAQAVTINVLSVQDPFYFPLEKLVPEFEKETGIKVNLQPLSYDAIHAKLVSSFITGAKGIDCVTSDLMWIPQYAENKWIIPLTPYIERDKEEVKIYEFQPQTLYSHEWRGDIYTLPITSYSHMVYYRTDIFEKAGLQPPPTEKAEWWTWDKYMEYVRKLDELGGGIHGTVIIGALPIPVVHMYTGLAVSKGIRWFKQFPKAPWDFTPTINTKENLEAAKYFKELYEHSPEESINFLWFDAGTAFATQDIGMYYHWGPYGSLHDYAGYMSKESSPNAGKYGVGVLPHQPGEEEVGSLGGWGLAIPQNSTYKEEAWEFIKWATSKETQKAMGLTPAPGYVFNCFVRTPLFEDKDLLEHYPYLSVHRYSIEHANGKLSRPPVNVYSTLEGFYGLSLNKALGGLVTPERALADTQSQFELVLKQNSLIPFKAESYDDTMENLVKLIKKLSP
ncbi:MAG TPA: sugar ABC transporter substrate-binding protein [Candidatus Atribacteria bacterium]|nr:sugar ABC transporter substrate-binding protein [Candidatus Atribacteria bacterium]